MIGGVLSMDDPVVRRLPHLDNLRTILVAWVIGGHALLGYSAVGGWAYDEFHEVTFAPATELVLVAIIGPSGLFVIGLFFFIAGLLTERSVARTRTGPLHPRPGASARRALARVGPAPLARLGMARRNRGRSRRLVLVGAEPPAPLLDSGSLWFALVLLIYSALFALWRWLTGPPVRRGATARRQAPRRGRRRHHGVLLRGPAVVPGAERPDRRPAPVAVARLRGDVRVRRGRGSPRWDRHVPDAVHRACRTATLATLVLLPPLALAAGVRDVATDAGPYLGGPHLQALATASVEGVLVVAGSVWLVGWPSACSAMPGGARGAWARGAFVAFVIQGPVLMALAAALRGFDAPAGVKAPLVAATAIAGCFWLGARFRFFAARLHGSTPGRRSRRLPTPRDGMRSTDSPS